ncbi:unnamed protein product, partial [Ectocarpus sp. 4 AP-2014]
SGHRASQQKLWSSGHRASQQYTPESTLKKRRLCSRSCRALSTDWQELTLTSNLTYHATDNRHPSTTKRTGKRAAHDSIPKSTTPFPPFVLFTASSPGCHETR